MARLWTTRISKSDCRRTLGVFCDARNPAPHDLQPGNYVWRPRNARAMGVKSMAEDQGLRLSDIWDTLRVTPSVFSRGPRSPWIPDGEYRVNDDDGRLRVIITFSAGIVHGPYSDYWSNGQIASVGKFEDGYRHGPWRYYNQDGSVSEEIHFVRGTEVVDWDTFFGENKGRERGQNDFTDEPKADEQL
jgi:hypothetical protein